MKPIPSHKSDCVSEDPLIEINEALIGLADRAAENLHRRAEESRNAVFGKKVFIRGVVEISSFCRQNCNYCGMRRDNRDLDRYRLSLEQLSRIVLDDFPDCITDINIQAGEDPIAVRELVVPFIREIRKSKRRLGVSVCLGTLDSGTYASLRETGASYYIIKLETGDPTHYRQVQAPGTLKKRLDAIQYLAGTGWNVSSGFIHGLPFQTVSHIVSTLKLLSELPLVGSSVSPFIAGGQTPYANCPSGNIREVLNCLAIMRLANPPRIIPAVSAMNLVGSDGYIRAIRAGANLATINLTPPEWRENYLLYKRDRFIMHEERVLSAIERADCTPSSTSLCDFLNSEALVNSQPSDS